MKTEPSPITGKPMSLIAEPEKVAFRGEDYAYMHLCYLCADSGEKFTTMELDGLNTSQVYNAYREKHGYPFPDEIAALRAYYGVSAAMMSEIMGFGANQWRYYEDEKVPNESNARAIMSIRHKSVFVDFLNAAKIKIGDKAFDRVMRRLDGLPEYKRLSCPTIKSGYVSYSPIKTAAAIKYFISQLGSVFVTKMNKLLFYADFLKYKREGFAMTGLEYRAIKFGPVPNRFGAVYDKAEGVEYEDFVYPNGMSGTLLQSDEVPDMDVFSDVERQVLEEVSTRFAKSTAGEISEKSHQERGWKECSTGRCLIPYSYAFDMEG